MLSVRECRSAVRVYESCRHFRQESNKALIDELKQMLKDNEKEMEQ